MNKYIVGIEQIHMLITEKDEERSADRDGWHQVRQEGDVVHVVRPLRFPVTGGTLMPAFLRFSHIGPEPEIIISSSS